MRLPIILLLLFLCTAGISLAQVEIVYPQNRQTSVERAPAITVRAPVPILRNGVSSYYPDADAMGILPDRPTVMVTDTAFDNLPLKQRVRKSAMGRYGFPDPRTLTFTPAHLVPGHTYRVSVDGLWVTGLHPTALPAVEGVFTVAPPTPKVLHCSMQDVQQLSCNTPISIDLSGSLEGGLGDVARIVFLEREQTQATNDWAPVDIVYSLVGKNITIKPTTTWGLGDILRLHVRMSMLTGDVMDDQTYSTIVRRATMVRVEAVADDGRTVPPSIADGISRMSHVVELGSTLQLVAQEQYDDRWLLTGWESPSFDQLVGLTPSVVVPCDGSTDEIVVKAILKRVDTIQIAITTDSTGRVLVFDQDKELQLTVTDTDTLTICDLFPSCTLVAVPAAGYTFQSWQATGTPANQSTTPVVTVGNGLLAHLVANQPKYAHPFSPKYSPNTPGTEIYGIRGKVSDQDEIEGWSANEAAHFTTEDHFTGATAVEKTICIEVERCWEIIGYVSSTTGTIETYDEPVNQACVTDVMSDPENVITFFVQRKHIQLRVEKALLASDDPTDLLSPDRLGASAKTTVELRAKSGTKTVWKTLNEQVCYDGDVQFSRYPLQCGDEVRITPASATVLGQNFRFFDAKPSYILPSVENSTAETPSYRVVLDLDVADFEGTDCKLDPIDMPEIRARACFRQAFGIEAIGFSVKVFTDNDRGKSKFVERWYDPITYRVLASDEPQGGRQIEYMPHEGTMMKIRFTMPIDQRSFLAGSVGIQSYGNILFSNPTATDLDFTTESSDGNVSFESDPGYSARTVVLSIMEPGSSPVLQALHCGAFKVNCSTDITSLTGVPLEHKISFLCQSIELPAYALRLHEISYQFDGDADFIFANSGETYHAVYGGDFGKRVAYGIDEGFRRIPDCSEQQGVPPGECTLPHSDKDGPQGFGDYLLWIQPNWLDWGDLAWWHVASYDEDCKDEGDCFVNRVQDLLDIAKEQAKKQVAADVTSNDIFKQLADLGIDFVRALLPADDQDEQIGYGTFIGTGGDLWGCKHTTTYLEIGDDNATYRLIPSLLVSRGVIR